MSDGMGGAGASQHNGAGGYSQQSLQSQRDFQISQQQQQQPQSFSADGNSAGLAMAMLGHLYANGGQQHQGNGGAQNQPPQSGNLVGGGAMGIGGIQLPASFTPFTPSSASTNNAAGGSSAMGNAAQQNAAAARQQQQAMAFLLQQLQQQQQQQQQGNGQQQLGGNVGLGGGMQQQQQGMSAQQQQAVAAAATLGLPLSALASLANQSGGGGSSVASLLASLPGGNGAGGANTKSNRICRHYARGRCTWGNQCRFSHDASPAELLAAAAAASHNGSGGSTGGMGQSNNVGGLAAVLGGGGAGLQIGSNMRSSDPFKASNNASMPAFKSVLSPQAVGMLGGGMSSGGGGGARNLYVVPGQGQGGQGMLFSLDGSGSTGGGTLMMAPGAAAASNAPDATWLGAQQSQLQVQRHTILHAALHAKFLIRQVQGDSGAAGQRGQVVITSLSNCPEIIIQVLNELQVHQALAQLEHDERVRDGGLHYLIGESSVFWSMMRLWHMTGSTTHPKWDQALERAMSHSQVDCMFHRSSAGCLAPRCPFDHGGQMTAGAVHQLQAAQQQQQQQQQQQAFFANAAAAQQQQQDAARNVVLASNQHAAAGINVAALMSQQRSTAGHHAGGGGVGPRSMNSTGGGGGSNPLMMVLQMQQDGSSVGQPLSGGGGSAVAPAVTIGGKPTNAFLPSGAGTGNTTVLVGGQAVHFQPGAGSSHGVAAQNRTETGGQVSFDDAMMRGGGNGGQSAPIGGLLDDLGFTPPSSHPSGGTHAATGGAPAGNAGSPDWAGITGLVESAHHHEGGADAAATRAARPPLGSSWATFLQQSDHHGGAPTGPKPIESSPAQLSGPTAASSGAASAAVEATTSGAPASGHRGGDGSSSSGSVGVHLPADIW